jgi:hypothetical protein
VIKIGKLTVRPALGVFYACTAEKANQPTALFMFLVKVNQSYNNLFRLIMNIKTQMIISGAPECLVVGSSS